MITPSDIREYVNETYNDGISVYDHGDYLRVTNGSAGMYVDFAVKNEELHIRGERYGETFTKRYEEGSIESVKDALSRVGL